MTGYRRFDFDNSARERVLGYLRLRETVVKTITVIKSRVDGRGGNGTGCYEIEIWVATAKLMNLIIAINSSICKEMRSGMKKVRCSSKMKPRLRAE